MSAKSRKMLSRNRKSSIRNSHLITPSTASRKAKNSVAFEFECESVNTSLSSVFTDNEVFTETKKKKPGRPKKIRNTESLRDCFKDPGSSESVSDSDNVFIKDVAKSTKTLTEIPLSASRSIKRRKKPIFTLPDITCTIKSESSNDMAEETISKMAKRKKKIRYTQDLNALSNDDRDFDIAVKTKPKKTKKSRLPSFLPPVDIIDENQKFIKTKAAENVMTDSDNKENDTNTESTTDGEGSFRKRKSKPRKTKKKLSKDKKKMSLDSNEETTTSERANGFKDHNIKNDLDNKHYNLSTQPIQESIVHSDKINTTISKKNQSISKNKNNSIIGKNNIKENTGNDYNHSTEEVTRNIRKPSGRLSKSNLISNFNVDISVKILEVPENSDNKTEDDTSEQPNKVDTKLSMDKTKQKRNTFEVSESPNKSIKMNHSMATDQNNLSKSQINVKRGTFNMSGNALSNTLNKTGNTSDFDDGSTHVCSKISLEQNDDNEESIKKSLKRATFDLSSSILERTSDDIEAVWLNNNGRSTSNRVLNRTIESVSNLQSLNTISQLNESATSLRDLRAESSKRSTFDMPSNLEDTCMEETSWLCKSQQSAINRVSNRTMESQPYLESLSTVSEPIASSIVSRSSPRAEFSKRNTFEISSNIEEASGRHQDSQLDECRRFTRNCVSNHTIETESNLDTLNTISKPNTSGTFSRTSGRTLRAFDKRSTFDSVPSLQPSNNTLNSRRATRTGLRRLTFDVNDTDQKMLESEKNSTFDNSIKFEEDIDKKSGKNRVSYDVLPPGKHGKIIFSISESSDSSEKGHGKNDTVIDLTESAYDDSGSSPSKGSRPSTLNKNPPEKRKSSFEVSFNNKKNPEQILDHLNITRLDSRKSSFKKKSSSGKKYSTGSDSEDAKPRSNFITMRRPRGCQTMIDFDTGVSLDYSNSRSGKGSLKKFKNMENLNGNRSGDKIVLSDKSSPEVSSRVNTKTIEKSTAKKSILNKLIPAATRSTRRDTFEIAEGFYDVYDSIKILKKPNQTKPSVSLISEVTPNVTLDTEPKCDIFDLVSRTPTTKLDKMMIGSGESLIVSQSFLNDSNASVMPRLTRTSTFTKNEVENKTPAPSTRKSTRKRWSQVERTPIFDKMPKAVAADQPIDTTLENTVNKSKSVTIQTPPDFSPRRKWNKSLKTTPSEAKAAEKGKKSVKIETPAKTPKIRLHSPLVMRKTPGPDFDVTNNSILSSNCVGKHSPQKTSTPYPKKKEVGLLQKVLTSEKNKSEKGISIKSIGKNSLRSVMPNFAKIHQRQYEKMENLKEMQERKAVRAQYLLSGSKPPANTSGSRITVEKDSRKQLKFSPKKGEPSKNASNMNTSRGGKAYASKPLSKPLQHMLNKRASLEKKKKEVKSKVPVAIAKPMVITTAKPEPKGFTRFGFKLPSGRENATKDEQIKAVTTKSKITVNRTETNRKQMGGVRSNRRFELLMKMRENKNKQAADTLASKGFIYQTKKQKKVNIDKSKQPEKVATSTGFKQISKPLQRMLNKRTQKKKNIYQGKSKIPVCLIRSNVKASEKTKGQDLEARGFTRFGFKLPRGKENITKSDQIKAVSLKVRIIKDRTEENRNRLREVRGNRRFELLMKLRETNK